MHEIHGWSRRLGWFMVLLTVLMLSPGDATAAEPKKFTLINVDLDGTKIWLPSSIMVYQGDEVELTLINKSDTPRRAGGLMSRAASKAAGCHLPTQTA